MKSIKVTYMGKQLREIYPHATKFQVFKYRVRRFMIQLAWCVVLALVVVGIFEAGRYINPPVVYTKQEVVIEVPVKLSVMDRIAKCESGGSHIAKNGQVLVSGNKNGSVDVGIYQINTLWFKEATDMGLNLFVEKDNITFANHLLDKYGTEPWIWTKGCWNK